MSTPLDVWTVLSVSTDTDLADSLAPSLEELAGERALVVTTLTPEELISAGFISDVAILDISTIGEQDAVGVAQQLQSQTPAPSLIFRCAARQQLAAQLLLAGTGIDAVVSGTKDENRLASLVLHCLHHQQHKTMLHDLSVQVRDGRVRWIEESYETEIAFVESVEGSCSFEPESLGALGWKALQQFFASKSEQAAASNKGIKWMRIEHLEGLPHGIRVLPFAFSVSAGNGEQTIRGGVCYRALSGSLSGQRKSEFGKEVALLAEGARLALAAQQIYDDTSSRRFAQAEQHELQVSSMGALAASLAHEVNTPLGVANAAASMVGGLATEIADQIKKSQSVDEDVADLIESAQLLQENLKRVESLVGRLRNLETGGGGGERTSVNLVRVVKELVATMHPATSTRGIDIMIDSAASEMPWVGYVEHFNRVLINMIQNIMRYAYPDEPGVVVFRLRVDESSARPYRIEIQDYGRGIAPEVLPRVFERFVTTGQDLGGTGIGLSICRSICEDLLQSKIKCESVLGEGTTFSLELPAEVPEAETDTLRRIELA